MGSAADIDLRSLALEAKVSKHNEAFQPMGRIGRIRIGVGARFTPQEKVKYFIELVVPLSSSSNFYLKELNRNLEVLKRLEDEGFSMNLQEDGSFCCELQTKSKDITSIYEKTVSLCDKYA